MKRQLFFYKRALTLLVTLLFIGLAMQCDHTKSKLRNWGADHRKSRTDTLKEEDLKKWMEDLQVSRDKALKIHKDVEAFVEESNRQGNLSWKIGKSFLEKGRAEMAIPYFQQALENSALVAVPDASRYFEESIPYFDEAIMRNRPDPDLLFDAGLCYANASRNLGWEEKRFRRAVLLFERLAAIKPNDPRPLYEMALLYGMTDSEELRRVNYAMTLLDHSLEVDPNHIEARFLKGHLLVRQGKWEEGSEEYKKIQDRVKDLYGSGMFSGNYKRDQRYIQCEKNISSLELCIRNAPGCSLMRED